MTITISSIPIGIRTPGSFIEENNVQAAPNLAPWKTKILVLGQALAGARAANLVPRQMFSAADGAYWFGRGSMLDRMMQAGWANNSTTEVWAMSAPDNPAGTAAVYTATVTGAPTVAGTIPFYVSGQLLSVGVATTDTPTTIAANIAAAVNADLDLPATATSALGVVTLTCRWKGETGNYIDFRTFYYRGDHVPDGIAIAFANPTPGAGNPVIAPVVAAFGDVWWNAIALPWTDGATMAAITTELANRRGPMVMEDGIAFASVKGTQGALATYGTGMNSPDVSVSECVGPVSTWERCAREAFLINFYGSIDPPRPLQTLALAGDMAPWPGERFTRAQRDLLLHDGISTHTFDNAGNVLLERPITTYQLNGAGIPDASYLDVTTMMTLSYLRYDIRVMMATVYPRHKLADDGTIVAPGQAMVTPRLLTAALIARARQWEAAGLVSSVDAWKANFKVERDPTDPSRVNAIIPPKIVSGLRVFAASLQFAF
jgi:phage tail sheath gpL-like